MTLRRGLYLHIPFCRQKCRYCGFYTVPADDDAFKPFVQAVIQEIQETSRQYPGPVDTVFFGGGTPSTLPLPFWEQILTSLHQHFRFREPAEWTVEMNPESVHEDLLRLLKDFGVNRLSLGVQSANDEELRCLGRIHDRRRAEYTISLAHRLGFSNLNLDLIFGIPGQSVDSWVQTLEWAVQQAPTHLSTYSLTLEPGTAFERLHRQGTLRLPSTETLVEMYRVRDAILGEHGYERYEISNFAQPGYACRHNRIYWLHHEYLGFGPSAASFVYLAPDRAVRWTQPRDLQRYLQRPGSAEEKERLGVPELLTERIFLGIRLREGIPFRKDWVPDPVWPYVEWADGYLRLNDEGVLVADRIAIELVSALEQQGKVCAETLEYVWAGRSVEP